MNFVILKFLSPRAADIYANDLMDWGNYIMGTTCRIFSWSLKLYYMVLLSWLNKTPNFKIYSTLTKRYISILAKDFTKQYKAESELNMVEYEILHINVEDESTLFYDSEN